ncbi:MAG: T9SS type A sorting domain-containing protein, partial [Thaumarchaeota archaeon]|nr:T9SS type A sorting domain-containing protein [Nitrososphaerota archaeon]
LLISVLNILTSAQEWHWQNPLPQGNGINDAHFVSDKIGWFAAAGGLLVHTKDGGDTWEIQSVGESVYLLNVEFVNELEGWASTDLKAKIYHTTDGGKVWIEDVFPELIFPNDLHFINHKKGWAVGMLGKIAATEDGGVTWSFQNSKTKNSLSAVDFVNDSLGWAVGNRSTIISTGQPEIINVKAEPAVLPVKFELFQNYPNPFNPVTSIEFELPEAGTTSLVIYNLRGEEVIRLIDGETEAGSHQLTWDASNVASGIYFYRLTSGNIVSTKKMVLLK